MDKCFVTSLPLWMEWNGERQRERERENEIEEKTVKTRRAREEKPALTTITSTTILPFLHFYLYFVCGRLVAWFQRLCSFFGVFTALFFLPFCCGPLCVFVFSPLSIVDTLTTSSTPESRSSIRKLWPSKCAYSKWSTQGPHHYRGAHTHFNDHKRNFRRDITATRM